MGDFESNSNRTTARGCHWQQRGASHLTGTYDQVIRKQTVSTSMLSTGRARLRRSRVRPATMAVLRQAAALNLASIVCGTDSFFPPPPWPTPTLPLGSTAATTLWLQWMLQRLQLQPRLLRAMLPLPALLRPSTRPISRASFSSCDWPISGRRGLLLPARYVRVE